MKTEKVMVGKVYSRLTVVSFERKDEKSYKYWKCRCVCGNEIITREERLKISGMEETRVDVITAGLAPLMRLCHKVNPKQIIFCSKSIREGVAAEALCDRT